LLATQSGAAMRQYVSVQLVAARRNVERSNGGGLGTVLGGRRMGLAGGRKRMRVGIGLVEHFGDIVACEPVARQMRAAYPDAEICWVVRDVFRELIDTNPAVDTTIAVDCLTDWIKWRAHGVFDKVVDLHVNQRICQHCGVPLVKREGNPAITGDNHFQFGGLLRAFSVSAGITPQDDTPRVYISDDAKRAVDELNLPERFVVFHGRSHNNEKDWEYPNWTALARQLIAGGTKVVEIGLVPTVTDESLGVINLCGRTSILQMAEVIKRSTLFIGIDSGPAHVANAVGAKAVVLLGQFGPFKSYNPYSGGYGAGRGVRFVRNDNGPAALLTMEAVLPAVLEALGSTASAAMTPIDVGSLHADSIPAPTQRDVAPRLIAFYLPQYHPIPLNDRAWGKGFTEWRNVGKSRAYFDGQYQPRLPGELGYYDLRVPEIMDQQAELAREHGIHGFCYYYYWFNGTRLLHLPIDNMLRRRKPDFPFCFCWANENWTRRWDGMDKEILAGQNHTPEDDIAFLHFIMPALEDPRYIRVNGKPLLLVYRTELFPDPQATAERWREESIKAGIGDLFLVRCEGFDPWTTPDSIGFDASYEVPTFILPDELKVANLRPLNVSPEFKGRIYDYGKIVDYYCARPETPYRRYRGPMLAWDNTPRHNERAVVFHDVTADKYERWIRDSLAHARRRFVGEERLLFVNAWNEWAEGSYLEPDLKYGRQFLEATQRAVDSSAALQPPTPLQRLQAA
jgi:ADP-heptose:LPS heptosyltransferase